MKKIGTNRYINPSKVVAANIYQKDEKIRVALSIDSTVKEQQTQFTDEFKTAQEAENFVNGLLQ